MARDGDAVSQWDEARQLGQIFICGFEGTSVNEQVKTLIESYYVGSILLTAKNLKSAAQTTKLVLDLQSLAHAAGHPAPLLIAIDQENGGVNSLYDEAYIRQFPSNMGIAATGSKSLAKQVANATAQELSAVGVNLILGPVLDVITNARSQPLGVRSFGDDPQEVSAFGLQFIDGYREAGVATCGKHFPSFEKLELLRESPGSPPIADSIHSLSQTSLIPFRDAINNGVDAILVGDVAVTSSDMKVMHACLSERIVDGLLRNEMHFQGVVVSECLELDLSKDIGIQGAAVMSVQAGCDLIMVCRSPLLQEEAMLGLRLGLENDMIKATRIHQSVSRVLSLKSKLSWEQALSPPGISALSRLQPLHDELSTTAYNRSITVVRDQNSQLPLTKNLRKDDKILLLTPLVNPLQASAAFHDAGKTHSSLNHHGSMNFVLPRSAESIFQHFGASLARHLRGKLAKLQHTSYSAHGVQSTHEELIRTAAAVIVITGDANRNKYQSGFAKHVSLLCKFGSSMGSRDKSCAVVAVSSPYDFAADPMIETYICTYDFTEIALEALIKVLCGDNVASGKLPEAVVHFQKTNLSRQQWLVETFNVERDSKSLENLLNIAHTGQKGASAALNDVSSRTFLLGDVDIEESHLVVRNSSTNDVFGFCATYYFTSTKTGHIALIVVDPNRRQQSIGHSLHARAIRALSQKPGIKSVQLGCPVPSIYLGLPYSDQAVHKQLCSWFSHLGWHVSRSRRLFRTMVYGLANWKPPDGVTQSLAIPDVKYELIQGGREYSATILEHVSAASHSGIKVLYQISLNNRDAGGIIRAKRITDGSILGSLLVCQKGSKLASYLPAISSAGGALSAPVISPSIGDPTVILQGLILLGIKLLKRQGVTVALLDTIEGDMQMLRYLGLETTRASEFDEIICDATAMTSMTIS